MTNHQQHLDDILFSVSSPNLAGKDNKNAERKNEVSNQNGENREQRFNRKNRENRENQPLNSNADGTANAGNNLNRGGGGGTGGGSGGVGTGGSGTGGGSGRNFNNERGSNRRQYGGKREFDRQSGSDKTGVKAIDKRDGGGAHNWGTHKQDIDDYQKGYDNAAASDESKTNKDDKANGEPKGETEQNGKDATEQVQIEEEAKEITLDEWKAQRAERAKPQYNIRKAGEGEDTSQWKKMIALDNRKKKVSAIYHGSFSCQSSTWLLK